MRSWVKVEKDRGPEILPQRTDVYSPARSPAILYKGPSKLEIFDTEIPVGPPFDGDGKRIGPAPSATLQLPADRKKLLVLVISVPSAEGQTTRSYRLLPFDDSLDTFPWGAYRFMNFTERTLIVSGGNDRNAITIPPNQAVPAMKFQGKEQHLQWKYTDKAAQQLVYAAKLKHRPSYRTLVIITDPDPNTPAISVRHIRERDTSGD